MRFQKSTEYSVRCLVWMARQPDRWVSVRELAERLDLPQKYLGRLFTALCRAGIVESQRGRSGGYRLQVPPERISVHQVIEAVGDDDWRTRCVLGFERCDEDRPCAMHAHWGGIRDQLDQMVQHVTLATLAAEDGIRV